MTFIPDSISKDDLLRIQVNAEADYVPAEDTDTKEVAFDDVIEAAFDKFLEENPTPQASKALALRLLSQLGAWHDVIADTLYEKKDESCLAWAGDEKLIHIAWSCLDRVEM